MSDTLCHVVSHLAPLGTSLVTLEYIQSLLSGDRVVELQGVGHLFYRVAEKVV